MNRFNYLPVGIIPSSAFLLSAEVLLLGALLPGMALATAPPRSIEWQFAKDQGAAPVDKIGGVKASLSGEFAFVPGVVGDGVRFDGYTTRMVVPAASVGPIGRNGFSVEAWVALNTYPWSWVPIIDQEKARQIGFSFGIDAFGHLGLGVSIDGRWQRVLSSQVLPLKRWVYVAATYDPDSDSSAASGESSGDLILYVDGKQVGRLSVRGEMSPATTDVLIGRVRGATLPFPEAALRPRFPVWYSLDGILDDLGIQERSLSAAEIGERYAVAKVPSGNVLPWPKLPSGPPGEIPFGAYYTTLHFEPAWDRLRRIGPDSDVVVAFGKLPIRLVFWQGTNYIPAWVTENDKWYTDEFLETWGEKGCSPGWDCEPMSDKQDRYSHVRILESDDARAVVRWRYALSEVEKYHGAWPDPETGWFDWADETWTIYPDGIAIRKQVLRSSAIDHEHEWQETIVLNQPGSRPEDDINWNAITLENMQGQRKVYSWEPKKPGTFSTPHGPGELAGPPDPNIQWVNMKSQWKPFEVIPPGGTSVNFYNNELTYFSFECWNHWPVAQIASSDRPCVAADRASHSSLSHLYWKPYAISAHSETKILMDGLTTMSPGALLPLAKSWVDPPAMSIAGSGKVAYDPTQRAYVLHVAGARRLNLTLDASPSSPAFDPAIVIHGWGDGPARLKLGGKVAPWGPEARVGHVRRMRGGDLVIWIERQTDRPLNIQVIPEAASKP